MTNVKPRTFIATLQGAQRLMNTQSGTPRWRVFTPTAVLLTEPDAQCALDITEHFGKLVRFTLNKEDRIVGLERVIVEDHE